MKGPLHQRRFGPFALDANSGELWRNGLSVRLQPKPTQLLLLLTEEPGRLYTRDEIAHHLWGDDTHVDYERSLNFAISQIRRALGDDAADPAYLQTLSRRGYRFIGNVRVAEAERAALAKQNYDPKENGSANAVAPEPARERAVDESTPALVEDSDARGRRRGRYAAFAVLVALCVCAAAWWFLPEPAMHTIRVTQLTTNGRIDFQVKPVTDGARVFYLERAGGHWNSMETSLEGGDPQPVPGLDANTRAMDISPDHATYLLGRFTSRGSPSSLWLMPVQGGSPVRLANIESGEAVWTPDGHHVLYASEHELWMVGADGTGARRFASLPGAPNWLAWSPDGARLRLSIGDDNGSSALWELNRDGSQLHRVLAKDQAPGEGQCCGEWTPDGRYFIFTAFINHRSNLWALREPRFALRREQNNPTQLTDWPGGAWGAHVSPDGNSVLFYAGRSRSQIVRLDMKTHEFVPVSAEGFSQPDYSPDGRWVLYTNLNNGMLWKASADGATKLPLTLPGFATVFPRSSPDGSRIAVSASVSGGPTTVYLLPASGGAPEMLMPNQRSYDPDWSPDGKSIVVVHEVPDHPDQRALFLVDLATRTERMIPGSIGRFFPHWSGDGRYIETYMDEEPGVAILNLETHKWKTVVQGTIGFPIWSHDSRTLYYQRILEEDEPVYRFNPRTQVTERVADCKQALSTGISRCAFMGLAPDDSPLFDTNRGSSDLYRAELSLPK
ncbi:MAG: winged helix-turn-helix domain-containing protein [Terracidiphilus sp.]